MTTEIFNRTISPQDTRLEVTRGHDLILNDDREIGYINYDSNFSPEITDIAGLDGSIPDDTVYLRFINVYVRNQGIGSVSYQEFEQSVKSQGYHTIWLIPNSRAAERFWKRQGFVYEDGKEKHPFRKRTKQALMVKNI